MRHCALWKLLLSFVFSLSLLVPLKAEKLFYLPHVANGNSALGAFSTGFVLFNPGLETVSIQVDISNNDGSPLVFPFVGRSPSAQLTMDLLPGGSTWVESDGSGELADGAAVVTASGNLAVSAIFSLRDEGGRLLTEAGIGHSSLLNDFIAPVIKVGSLTSGLALFNPGLQSGELELNLVDSSGEVVATGQTSVLGGAHRAILLDELFPGIQNSFQGTIEVLSSVPIAALTLRVNLAKINYTTLPIVERRSPETSFFLPQVADGEFSLGSISTTFMLFNLNSEVPVEVALKLKTDDGTPLSVGMKDLGTGSEFHLEIPGRGVLFLQTDSSQSLETGSASVASNGPIGAAGLFTVVGPEGDFVTEAGVSHSPATLEQTVPTHQRGSLSTGVALFNESQEAMGVRAQLFDAAGLAKSDVVTLDLPAEGHLARFSNELFGRMASFEGTIVLSADRPFSLIALRQNADPLNFTTLPAADSAYSYSKLTDQVISSEGGALQGDGFELQAPGAAFTGETHLSLFRSGIANPLGDPNASPAYLVKELPFDYASPLTVRIRAKGEAGETPLIAVGTSSFVSSAGEQRITFQFLEADFEDGWLTAELPVGESLPGGADEQSPAQVAQVGTNIIFVGFLGWTQCC